jgi:hypothetical protein
MVPCEWGKRAARDRFGADLIELPGSHSPFLSVKTHSCRPFDRTDVVSALVDYFCCVEPPHSYVHESSSSVVHHGDYLNHRDDHALCGVTFENPAPLGPTISPGSACPDCEAKLAEYHLIWWRERAEAVTAELDELRVKYRELAEYVENQRHQVAGLQRSVQGGEDLSGEDSESRGEIAGTPQGDSTAEQGEATPASVLDQARKELSALCRRSDEAVPFWRVKKCMEALSDELDSDERVLLAQELGADGSFIRWCTTEIERLGFKVSNNRVHGDANAMMDEWTQDMYQPPKKTRWGRGRSRSHNGS